MADFINLDDDLSDEEDANDGVNVSYDSQLATKWAFSDRWFEKRDQLYRLYSYSYRRAPSKRGTVRQQEEFPQSECTGGLRRIWSILRDSSVWTKFENELGDSGYPCRFWLLTPFESPSTPAARLFNQAHRKSRVRIEQAFGQLKRRFYSLYIENGRNLKNTVIDIGACVILHNFAKMVNDPDDFEEFPGMQQEDAGDVNPQGGFQPVISELQ